MVATRVTHRRGPEKTKQEQKTNQCLQTARGTKERVPQGRLGRPKPAILGSENGIWGGPGASWGLGSPPGAPKRAPRGLLEASWAFQGPKKSCQEGPLIVLEVQGNPVLRKKAPQEGSKRGPRGVQNRLRMEKVKIPKMSPPPRREPHFGVPEGSKMGPR